MYPPPHPPPKKKGEVHTLICKTKKLYPHFAYAQNNWPKLRPQIYFDLPKNIAHKIIVNQ